MVTDPVVMVISVSVTNKESVAILIAPTSDCRKILVYQKSISIWSLIDKIIKIVLYSIIDWLPHYAIFLNSNTDRDKLINLSQSAIIQIFLRRIHNFF